LRLIDLLGLSAGVTICDVGAGSGNYANALADRGYRILAVEPSATMARQARPHKSVSWHQGFAENLPIPDAIAAANVCILAAHHFNDLHRAAAEFQRVAPTGPWVFFTMDPRRGEDQWFGHYFPDVRKRDYAYFPAIEDFISIVTKATMRVGNVSSFPLPRDLADEFMYAPWSSPERYLDPLFRANTSGFALADPSLVSQGVARLSGDLATGRWEKEFGRFRGRAANDAGFCFVTFRP